MARSACRRRVKGKTIMSGGSYDYLEFSLSSDPSDAFKRVDDLERMQARLAELGYGPESSEMGELVMIIKQVLLVVEARVEALAPIMRAVEWLDSGDSVDEDLLNAIKKHRKLTEEVK